VLTDRLLAASKPIELDEEFDEIDEETETQED
jgi:ribosome maturation factor RimP